jgi:urease accessory protein
MSHPKHAALLATAACLIATPAMAHSGHATDTGVVAGLLHPLSGLDHVLAMTLIGVLAAQLGGRHLWQVPAAFLAFAAVGSAMGLAGFVIPQLEAAIGLSVAVLGLMAISRVRLPAAAAVVVAGGSAVLHGAAHGTELPAGANALGFVSGFLLSTAILHAAGLALGRALSIQFSHQLKRDQRFILQNEDGMRSQELQHGPPA